MRFLTKQQARLLAAQRRCAGPERDTPACVWRRRYGWDTPLPPELDGPPVWAPETGSPGYLSASEDVPAAQEPFDPRTAYAAHQAELERLHKTAQEELFWRKIATGAAIAGALFAAARLTDIWLAVKSRRRSS